jgi:uncharacterized protein
VTESHELLRLNVGFIVHQTIGYYRDFPFDVPAIYIPPDLDLTNLNGVVRVTRTAQGLLVQVNLHAGVQAECVRCLTEFTQILDIDFTDLYAFNKNSVTESGLILPDNGKINLAPIVRDEMILAMPISPLCRQDCKGLCLVCGENLNETDCGHNPQSLDTSQMESDYSAD